MSAAEEVMLPTTLPLDRIVCGEALATLRTFPADSVHCVVTSPPYWGLRDYGVAGAIGLEASLDEWVTALVAVLREVRRVLRPDGCLWLNLGDSFAGSNMTGRTNSINGRAKARQNMMARLAQVPRGLKPKDLCGQPWRVAFALQADGWYLRSDIIWHKPNPMPESVTDRPTKSHEYLFLLTKSERYYYDAEAIREPHTASSLDRAQYGEAVRQEGVTVPGSGKRWHAQDVALHPTGRNKRDVWTIATEPYPGAHFATFPTALVEPCVLAGSAPRVCEACGAPWRRVVTASGGTIGHSWHDHHDDAGRGQRVTDAAGKGIALSDAPGYQRTTTGWRPTCRCTAAGSGRAVVLDPFAGTATACYVAKQFGRHYVGIELNPKYVALGHKRLASIPFALWLPEEVTG